MGTELINQKASADGVPSAELVFVKYALATAQAEAKKAQVQLALVEQKQDTFEGYLHKDVHIVADEWHEKVKAWCEEVVAVEITLDKIRVTDSEMVDEFPGQQDAAGARLHKFVVALRSIIKDLEEQRTRQPIC